MSEEYYLICENPSCSWSGDDSELVAKSDNLEDNQFIYCPYCGGTEFDEDFEEEEEDG